MPPSLKQKGSKRKKDKMGRSPRVPDKKLVIAKPDSARLNWHLGFKLEELAHSHGDFNYINEKMHSSLVEHASGIVFSGYDIQQVYKVLNSETYERYRQRRQQMNAEITRDQTNSSYVEEMRLWHGSPHAEKICKEGFSLQPSNANGMFGKGIYFAEHSSKSNQYSWGVGGGCPAHHNMGCYLCPRHMLLCKVALGRKLLTKSLVNQAPSNVDTVVAKPDVINVGLRYPEYVIYNQDQAYPGYLIRYKILPPRCAECERVRKLIQDIKTDGIQEQEPNIVFPERAADVCTIS